MSTMSARRPVVRLRPGGRVSRPDDVAVEEPLLLRVDGVPTTLTMRTPGHDLDLALGWLVGEGVLSGPDDVLEAVNCPDATSGASAVDVRLRPGVVAPPPRTLVTTSACGVCGSEAIADVETRRRLPTAPAVIVDASVLAGFPSSLRAGQRVFDRTGGLHAAAMISLSGEVLLIREDVGRHNAVDKVVGAALMAGLLPAHGCALQVSGRASFELVQKAVMAGFPVLSAVSAPSSLAVDLARAHELVLAGFVRGDTMNIYSGGDRVTGMLSSRSHHTASNETFSNHAASDHAASDHAASDRAASDRAGGRSQ